MLDKTRSGSAFWLAGTFAAALLAGCVNQQTTTAALTPEIQPPKEQSHEQAHVAKRCNSGERLHTANVASAALNAKFTEYAEAGLAADRRDALSNELKARAQTLQSLDQALKLECQTYSVCEYHSGLDERDCTSPKGKFREAEKAMTQFADAVGKIKIQ